MKYARWMFLLAVLFAGYALWTAALAESALFVPMLVGLAGALLLCGVTFGALLRSLERSRFARPAAILLGAAYLSSGQVLIFRPRPDAPFLIGYGLIGVGLVVIGLAATKVNLRAEAPAAETVPPIFRVRWLAAALIGSLLASIITQNAIIALGAWLFALIAVLVAVAPPGFAIRLPWREGLLVGVLFLTAFAIRGIGVDSSPALYDQDEARFSIDSDTILRADHLAFTPFGTDYLGYPRIYAALIAVSAGLFGQTMGAARLVSALMGALGVVAVYGLGREISGWRVGLASAAFMLAWPFHVHFSRLSMNQVGDALFVTLAFWSLVRGLRHEQPVDLALSGICLGTSQLFYFTARFALVPFGLVLLLMLRYRRQLPLLIPFALGLLIAALPQHLYLLLYHVPLSQRSAEFALLNESFRQSLSSGGLGALLEPVQRSFLALFSFPPDTAGWYGDSSNLMGPLGGGLLLLGLVAVFRRRERNAWLPVIWAIGAIVLGSVLTNSPPQFQRYVAEAGALALLVGFGVDYLCRSLPRPALWLVAASLALVAGNLAYYEGTFVPEARYLFNRPNFVMNAIARRAISEADAGQAILIVGDLPTSVGPSNIVGYLMAGRSYRVILEPLQNTQIIPDALPANARGVTVFIAPTRLAECEPLLKSVYPKGAISAVKIPQMAGYADDVGYYLFRVQF